jgi:hypothetical protein
MSPKTMTKRRVLLIELSTEGKTFSSKAIERDMNEALGDRYGQVVVWGCVDGVDAAYRQLRQLSAETERGAPLDDRVHSAWKALSFFRDMFPAAFWEWKRIGGDHPTPDERPMMAGR